MKMIVAIIRPEKLEEVRLKKLKLSIKDEMERLRRMEASGSQG